MREPLPRRKKTFLKDTISSFPLISAIFVGISFLLFEHWVTAVGIGIVAFTFTQYVESLGKKMAIKEMIAVIASFQWILGPYIAYTLDFYNYKYFMYVGQEEYMDYVVPAMAAFVLGMNILKSKYSFNFVLENFHQSIKLRRRHIYLIIFIGIFAGILSPYIPRSFAFIVFFVIQLKYVGLLYLLMVRDKSRWLMLFIIMGFTLTSSLEEGLFHNFILWSAFIFSFICIELRLSRKMKYLVLVFGMVSIVSIQSVKSDYRDIIRGGYSGSKVVLFFDMIIGSPDSFDSIQDKSFEEKANDLNVRLNQGWIISAVLSYVPRRIEFSGGETIIDAFSAALVPRFLIDKRKASVSDNFRKYTGLQLSEQTSMGISVLGEAYVNFGNYFGAVFMFAWGLVIGFILKYLMDYSIKYPSLFLWAPLVFLQVVKAETELVIVLNHAVKSVLFLTVFYILARRVLRWKI